MQANKSLGRTNKEQTRIRLMMLVANFAIAFLSIAIALLYQSLPLFQEYYIAVSKWASDFVSQSFWRLILTILICSVAYVLFVIREKYLFLYAILEVAFGLSSTWYALGIETENRIAQYISIIGACYILVRGLTNIRTAKKNSEL